MSYARGVGIPREHFYIKSGNVYFNHGIVQAEREYFVVISNSDGIIYTYRTDGRVPPIGYFKRLANPHEPLVSRFEQCLADGSPYKIDVTI